MQRRLTSMIEMEGHYEPVAADVPTSIQARDRKHLKELIQEHIDMYGNHCNLNHIDVSGVADMQGLFRHSGFHGDISLWDVSNVTDMEGMFYECPFNGDLSGWNVSKVTVMKGMFRKCLFNGDISRWDVSNVKDMNAMFYGSAFTGNIASWNLNNLQKYEDVFTTFNDSLLGYVSVLQRSCTFPQNDPRAAQFETLRSLCEGLNMDTLSAAQHIYEALHRSTLVMELLPVDETVVATLRDHNIVLP